MRFSGVGLLAVTMLGTFPLAVEAQSALSFLKDAPAGHFNKQDWELLKTAMHEVLEAEDDNASKRWRNEATGHSGTVTTLKKYTSGGKECRQLQFENEAEGRTGRSHYKLCREADGHWRELSSGFTLASLARVR